MDFFPPSPIWVVSKIAKEAFLHCSKNTIYHKTSKQPITYNFILVFIPAQLG